MTTTSVGTIEQPTNFRSGRSANASDITRGKILKYTSTKDVIDLATATTDKLAGISTETIEANGLITRSYQVREKAMCKSGAAVAIGDRIRPDAQGRGVAATVAGQQTIGVAVSIATAADQDFELEIERQPYVVPA
jgi:hypothetical protein